MQNKEMWPFASLGKENLLHMRSIEGDSVCKKAEILVPFKKK